MGEYADYAIDAGIDEYWGSSDGYLGRRPYLGPTCRRCGQKHLSWSAGPNYYLLEWNGTRDVRHVCKLKNAFKQEDKELVSRLRGYLA